jgi:Flp pilus assembly protein TadD
MMMIAPPRPILILLTAATLYWTDGCTPRPQTTIVHADMASDTAAARAQTDHAYALIQAGKNAEAEPLLKRAIAADPTYGPARNDMGLIRYQQDRLYDAAWEFENAIKLMPQSPEPRNNLGLVLEKAQKLEEAEKSFARAHDLAAQNSEYAGNLARIRLRRDERDGHTRALLEQVILSDTRPEWVQWARLKLIQISGATSHPAETGGNSIERQQSQD